MRPMHSSQNVVIIVMKHPKRLQKYSFGRRRRNGMKLRPPSSGRKKQSKTCTGMGTSPYISNSKLAEFRTFTTFPVIRPAVKAMMSKHDRAFAQTWGVTWTRARSSWPLPVLEPKPTSGATLAMHWIGWCKVSSYWVCRLSEEARRWHLVSRQKWCIVKLSK